jgi:hypothetical protein
MEEVEGEKVGFEGEENGGEGGKREKGLENLVAHVLMCAP